MPVYLTLEELDYLIDLVKGGNPASFKMALALKLAVALLDCPVENHAQKTAAPDPD